MNPFANIKPRGMPPAAGAPSAPQAPAPSPAPAPAAPAPVPPPGGAPSMAPQQSPMSGGSLPPEMQPIAAEMTIIESWMKSVLMQSPEGQQIVRDYYTNMPLVMRALSQAPDWQQTAQEILVKYVKPTTAAIKEGDYAAALVNYLNLEAYSLRFAAQNQQDPEVESTLMESAAKDEQMAADPSEAKQVLGQESSYNPNDEGNGGSTSMVPDTSAPPQAQAQPGHNPMGVGQPTAPPPAPTAAPMGGMPMQPPMPTALSNIKARRQ